MDPISIKITFQDVPQELTNYLTCLFYLAAILICTIIMTLFAHIYESVSYHINKENYLHLHGET
jgi:uncharacterized membrane protein YkvI